MTDSPKGGKKRTFLGLIELDDAPESAPPTPPPAARARATPPPSGPPPSSISGRMGRTASAARPAPAPTSVDSASLPDSSERVAKMLEELKEKLPVDNLVAQVMIADDSLKAAIADSIARRNAAIGVVKSTEKISDADLARDGQAVTEAIDAYFDHLKVGIQQIKEGDVAGIRLQAQGHRQSAESAREQIRALEQQIQADTAEAERLERHADEEDAQADTTLRVIEAASAAAHQIYRV